MQKKTMSYQEIIDFWFEEIEPKFWFKKDDTFDQTLMSRFGDLHSRAENSELFTWRGTAEGRLAEIIVLDQFSRNLYRGTPRAFVSDPLALALAQEAISQGLDANLSTAQRTFLYMPYMHSESKAVHEMRLPCLKKTASKTTSTTNTGTRLSSTNLADTPIETAYWTASPHKTSLIFCSSPVHHFNLTGPNSFLA